MKGFLGIMATRQFRCDSFFFTSVTRNDYHSLLNFGNDVVLNW